MSNLSMTKQTKLLFALQARAAGKPKLKPLIKKIKARIAHNKWLAQ